jgi:hypothetical protein
MTIIRSATPIEDPRFANKRGTNQQDNRSSNNRREDPFEDARLYERHANFEEGAYE